MQECNLSNQAPVDCESIPARSGKCRVGFCFLWSPSQTMVQSDKLVSFDPVITVSDFAETIEPLVPKPVVDQTGLTGSYDLMTRSFGPNEINQVFIDQLGLVHVPVRIGLVHRQRFEHLACPGIGDVAGIEHGTFQLATMIRGKSAHGLGELSLGVFGIPAVFCNLPSS